MILTHNPTILILLICAGILCTVCLIWIGIIALAQKLYAHLTSRKHGETGEH